MPAAEGARGEAANRAPPRYRCEAVAIASGSSAVTLGARPGNVSGAAVSARSHPGESASAHVPTSPHPASAEVAWKAVARAELGRSDDEEGVAVGIAQAELRGNARQRRAAPPHHVPLTKWLLVHVEALGAGRGEVREDVSAEEHHARLDPR